MYEKGIRFGESVYLGSYQYTRPTVGMRTLAPNAVKSRARGSGLTKADFTVRIMQATVNRVIMHMKMYLHTIYGPHAYL